ncbi:MAG: hypothetical protein WC100_01525 [Sterolibacterium sp.]
MVDEVLSREAEMLAEEQYDASDKKQVNNARKKAARMERERLEFVRAIMTVPAGRKWMYGLLVDCKIFDNPIVPGETHYTYHNIGAQNIGKKLFMDINDAAPEEYITMMREARESK